MQAGSGSSVAMDGVGVPVKRGVWRRLPATMRHSRQLLSAVQQLAAAAARPRHSHAAPLAADSLRSGVGVGGERSALTRSSLSLQSARSTTAAAATVPLYHLWRKRGHFSNNSFVVVLCAYVLGLGIWRFPYMCYNYGGALFFVPYVLCVLLAALPTFYMELVIGQYISRGPLYIYAQIAPLFKGVGISMALLCALLSIGCNMLNAWSLLYMATALTSDPLPWVSCRNAWNTHACYSAVDERRCVHAGGNMRFYNGSCFDRTLCVDGLRAPTDTGNASALSVWPAHVAPAPRGHHLSTLCFNHSRQVFSVFRHHLHYKAGQGEREAHDNAFALTDWLHRRTDFGRRTMPKYYALAAERRGAADEYFLSNVYTLSDGDPSATVGDMRASLLVSLFVAWLVVALCLALGIRSLTVVCWTLVVVMVAALVLFAYRAFSVRSTIHGLAMLLFARPNYTKLAQFDTWQQACGHAMYSTGVGVGVLSSLASYSHFHDDVYEATLRVVTFDIVVSVLWSGTSFGLYAIASLDVDVKLSRAARQLGPTMPFTLAPLALAHMKPQWLWHFCFYLMTFAMSMGSQLCMVEMLCSTICDIVPRARRRPIILVFAVCTLCFVLGLPMCLSKVGLHYFITLEQLAAGAGAFFLAFVQHVVVAWIYGTTTFQWHIVRMVGIPSFQLQEWIGPTGRYFLATWTATAPYIYLIMFAASLRTVRQPSALPLAALPAAFAALHLLLNAAIVLCVPAAGGAQLVRAYRRHSAAVAAAAAAAAAEEEATDGEVTLNEADHARRRRSAPSLWTHFASQCRHSDMFKPTADKKRLANKPAA